MTKPRLDPHAVLGLLDTAYDDSLDASWREGLLEQAQRLLPNSRTIGFYAFKSRNVEGGISLTIDGELTLSGEDAVETSLRELQQQPPAVLDMLLGRNMANTASTQTGAGVEMASWPQWRAMWRPPVVDSLGLVARDPSGDGLLLFTGLTATTRLNDREQALLNKIVAHLGAAHRLRRAKHVHPLEEAEAILSPTGKLLHGTEGAENKREALDEGRLRRKEAQRTTHDAEKALEIWKGLVAGRWSLVDHFDTDGKRFLLAMKNTPAVDKRAGLTPRERRVCALAAMGHRDKEVAYMLGLSLASVSAALHRARMKLGVTSRAGLVSLWRRSSDA